MTADPFKAKAIGLDGAELAAFELEALLTTKQLLAPVIRHTPLEPCRVLSERLGGPVRLKAENLQRTGSFKLRGAYTRIARLTDDERRHGVVAASAGNHAQGVALAARLLGLPATVYMPEAAALPKVEATRGYGATVELTGRGVADALAAAAAHAGRTGAVLIHPFDHPDVIAGQATLGLEILEQCPDVATVLVPTGGGGLLAGVAAAVAAVTKGRSGPPVDVVGVQAAGAAGYPPSLAAGRPLTLAATTTMADGIAVATPGELPFEIIRMHAAGVVTVSEELISRALLLLLERVKLVVEPAGAVAVAALLDREAARRFRPPVVAILSGGNIDPLLQMRVIRHGMAAAGRYLQVHLALPDQPGALAALLTLLATEGANVLDVEHAREGVRVGVQAVEVGLRLELRGREHRDQLLVALRNAGYRVSR